MSEADFPEEGVQAVGHEPERREWLLVAEFGDVLAELLFAFSRAAGGALGFDNAEDRAGGMIQGVVGYAIPRLGIVTGDRNFEADLSAVTELPLGVRQERIDQ